MKHYISKSVNFFFIILFIASGCYTTSIAKNNLGAINYTNLTLGDTSVLLQYKGEIGEDTRIFKQIPRKLIQRNVNLLPRTMSRNKENGVISATTCINRLGLCEYVEIDQQNTTITDKRRLAKTLEYLASYEFEPNPKAPEYQCGNLKLVFDVEGYGLK